MKLVTLKKKAEFAKLKKAKFYYSKNKLLLVANIINLTDSDTPPPKFGLTISRKHGNAVTRNLLRRRLKAILQETIKTNNQIIHPNAHYLFIPRPGMADFKYDYLKRLLTASLTFLKQKMSQK